MPTTTPTFPTLILGAGRLGRALAQSLSDCDWPVLGVWNRSPQAQTNSPYTKLAGSWSAPTMRQAFQSASLLILAVSDDAIATVVSQLVEEDLDFATPPIVAHASGQTPASILAPLAETYGCPVGAFHPLQAITGATKGPLFSGIAVGIEGHAQAKTALEAMVQGLAGRSFSLTGVDRRLYHAAAVMASNYLVTLADQAQTIMTKAGVPLTQALPLLLPLMQASLDNLAHKGLPQALTGPLSRGDLAVIKGHLCALQEHIPLQATLYQTLAVATLPIATAQRQQDSDRRAKHQSSPSQDPVGVTRSSQKTSISHDPKTTSAPAPAPALSSDGSGTIPIHSLDVLAQISRFLDSQKSKL